MREVERQRGRRENESERVEEVAKRHASAYACVYVRPLRQAAGQQRHRWEGGACDVARRRVSSPPPTRRREPRLHDAYVLLMRVGRW